MDDRKNGCEEEMYKKLQQKREPHIKVKLFTLLRLIICHNFFCVEDSTRTNEKDCYIYMAIKF